MPSSESQNTKYSIHGHHHQGISKLYTITYNVIYKMCGWFFFSWRKNQPSDSVSLTCQVTLIFWLAKVVEKPWLLGGLCSGFLGRGGALAGSRSDMSNSSSIWTSSSPAPVLCPPLGFQVKADWQYLLSDTSLQRKSTLAWVELSPSSPTLSHALRRWMKINLWQVVQFTDV